MTTEERLTTLERRFKWLAVGGAVVLACVAIWLAAWARPIQVEARGFILVDANGKTRAMLKTDAAGTGLVILDENGKPHGALIAREGESRLVLCDENGKNSAILSTDKDGPMVALTDENDKTRARLSMDNDGPKLALSAENGKANTILEDYKDVRGLFLADSKGITRALLAIHNQLNVPQLQLSSEIGKPCVVVTGDPTTLILLDGQGKSLWKAP